MKSWHLLSALIVIAAGYALGRYFPQVGQKVGLP